MIKNLSNPRKTILVKCSKYGKKVETIIVPVCKPGKDPALAESYRPIALTSHLGKIMEKMVNERLIDFLETNSKIKYYQSGFRKGRSKIDPAVRLEHEIRRAQVNRESVAAVIVDVEKAYDVMWKEGLLIRLHQIGIKWRMYKWICRWRNRANPHSSPEGGSNAPNVVLPTAIKM